MHLKLENSLTLPLPWSFPQRRHRGSPQSTLQLVRGQNNVDVWGHNADRLAVVITDPAPFDIEVVQPQVPLVRDGTMPLIVKAKRNEGFDKPINLRLLYAPRVLPPRDRF